MTSSQSQDGCAETAFEPGAHCTERRMTNRLWACNVIRRNRELDRTPNQSVIANAYAAGAYKVLETFAPRCAGCRYR